MRSAPSDPEDIVTCGNSSAETSIPAGDNHDPADGISQWGGRESYHSLASQASFLLGQALVSTYQPLFYGGGKPAPSLTGDTEPVKAVKRATNTAERKRIFAINDPQTGGKSRHPEEHSMIRQMVGHAVSHLGIRRGFVAWMHQVSCLPRESMAPFSTS
ncbi:hypothetical protein GQ53DRAFT_811832 [Thozetella sp. PMI_491]|nr:hypothetical protein GQ53DRAFT_811832 [Thozetella sp. PMI_491]